MAVETAEKTPAAPTPVTPSVAGNLPAAVAEDEVVVKAPMVGTFYASPKPGAPAFVSVGDKVTADTVLCIVEVMKLMNNVEAQVEGTVTQILVSDNQAVEFGQPLMVIKRSA
jgi:acetyl-CoA carboxylase biotin carboxyl carrier protein